MIPEVVDQGRPEPERRPLSGRPPQPGPPPTGPVEPPVVRVDGGAWLAITTWRSSNAPRVPVAVEVEGDGLTIALPGGIPVAAW